MDLFVLCVACQTGFMNSLVKQFEISLGAVTIFCLMLCSCLVWLELEFGSWITCVCSPYVFV